MYDKDSINDFFNKLSKTSDEELALTEQELEKSLEKINKILSKIDENIKKAEEEGDELLYNLEINKKNLVLQKIRELEVLSLKIKK
jgi:Asp-tRNA(Asn)/Glu-tRNA(Gln) amidotransferase C subunit